MKKEESQIGRYLTGKNATVLFLIAATVLVGQSLIQILVARQHGSTHIVNVAGRQRMLSQKISKDALKISYSTDAEEIARSKGEMGKALLDWESTQAMLEAATEEMWFVDLNKAEIASELSSAASYMTTISAAARRMLSSEIDPANPGRLLEELRLISDNEAGFLAAMESVVTDYQDEYDDWIAMIRLAQLAFVIVILVLLAIQWRYLLKPAISKIEGAVIEFEKLGTAVENASDHIIITDTDGTIGYANAAAESITGFKKSEMIGKKAGGKDLWGGSMSKEFYDKMWKTLTVDREVFRGRVTNHRKDGSEYVAELGISPILGAGGQPKYFVGIERDITKEVQVDRAKTEFVSMAAHQLRTPIATSKWYLEMILDEDVGKLKPKQKEYLGEVQGANDRMADIVDDFLNVSRIELGTFQIDSKPIPFSAAIRECAVDLKPDIEAKRLKLSFELPEKSFVLNADKGLLQMIFGNLISNAVKYTPEGGRIAVKAEVDRRRKKLVVSVSDTGVGIPSSQQGMIFSKMFRADNARNMKVKGTGLGLYIVKSVVETAGGSLGFESAEGKGSTFTVVLPLSGMKSREGFKRLS